MGGRQGARIPPDVGKFLLTSEDDPFELSARKYALGAAAGALPLCYFRRVAAMLNSTDLASGSS
jgi:hypothetical protein